jgi:TIR domain
MAEVFISYSQKDRALIAPFAGRLAELGVEAWFDREISAGESFGAVIRARLKEAKAILVCWSPEAIESKWVDAEAEYAREVGSYLPIYIAPCALLPPFNTIHADDLSNWKGEANDPAWIRLVGRIAKLIDREGVAAAARVLASGDEQARYDFARRFPDEPTAAKIWGAAEASHRERFRQRMLEATSAAEAKINAVRASLEGRLKAAAPAFDLWLAGEQHATTQGPPPDPLDLIEHVQPAEDPRFRDEIATLQSALTRAKAKENQLDAATAEIARLSSVLAALQAKEGLEPAQFSDRQRLRDEIATLRDALTKAKSRGADLDATKPEAETLSVRLAAAQTARSRAYALAALIGLVAVSAVVQAEVQANGKAKVVAELADLRDASNGLAAQIRTLNSVAEAADKKQTETQTRADLLAQQLQGASNYASNLNKELAAAKIKQGSQGVPLTQISAVSPKGNKDDWFVVVETTLNPYAADSTLAQLNRDCETYSSASNIISQSDSFKVVIGPYSSAGANNVVPSIQQCFQSRLVHAEKIAQ